ncbi:isoprenyl transferase [Flavobacterium agricola]|uniref:Isoprenyl transferase n=1 Tax=Flavobacterium agricola TaxID=2870839 RepID=A0ABY6M1J0_9FLAO|nr:isoprenyl transferase [Flavobacterium agricola]UYW00743.1 isoprenyl transferase [Flavobacterium agricola]
MNTIQDIDKNNVPAHIAVIMDGNGRWAKKQGMMRVFGHENGVTSVKSTIEAAAKIGVKYLTLYAFSTENWNRPKFEVDTLMSLLFKSLKKELKTLNDNNIKLNVIGSIDNLPNNVKKELEFVIEQTKNNTHMTVTLALSYGSRNEIVEMVKKISSSVKNNIILETDIDESIINKHLYTSDLPDVDLLIRTSGECRISNFMLWQIAYAELYFTEVLWPDFTETHFYNAILSYQNRERRFGKTSEQIK